MYVVAREGLHPTGIIGVAGWKQCGLQTLKASAFSLTWCYKMTAAVGSTVTIVQQEDGVVSIFFKEAACQVSSDCSSDRICRLCIA